jgi:myo-inositol-1(or 4)-monophosphatase
LPAADLALLEAAAREAGALALSHRGRAEVREKPGGHGPVTDADLAVDRMLRAELTAARPDYGWLSEESEDGPARLAASHVFIVDPIDGTRAFIAGRRAWALSLAVAVHGRVAAGVVHLPMLERTYSAAPGQGARLNGVPIAASPRAALDGAQALVSGSQMDPAFWPGGVPRLSRHFRPSLAYRLCLVAEGRFDATLSFRDTWEWDVAAGEAIAREAGAVVTARDGCAPAYNRPAPALAGVVAAGPALHAGIMARLRPDPRP